MDFDHFFPPVYVQAPVSEIGGKNGAGGPEKPGGGGRIQHPVVDAEGKSLVLEVSSRVPGQRPVQVGREAVDSFSEPPGPGVYPGFFPGMEADFQAVVSRLKHSGKTGFAFQIGEAPLSLMGILQKRIAWQELVVDAGVKGDRNLALQALLLDEMAILPEHAEAMLNDLLAASRDLLPQFE